MNARTAHPTSDVLRALGTGKLDEASVEPVLAHLETCHACQTQLSGLSGDSVVARLRAAHDAVKTRDAMPAFVELEVLPELRNHPQYEVVRELGRGGMGVVYLANNKLMERAEVLKVVNKQLLGQDGAAERFLREIRSAAKLNHPNIVTAYTTLQVGELLVLAMEYVEGDDLAKVVKTHGPLPVANACFYMYQAALGLQHASDRGMIHRDIKPGNLILARDGKKHIVKILDFGLAKATREGGTSHDLTGDNKMLGTPDYIAPEQARDATRADIRADIYSLGCSLHYLLTGSAPFQAHSLYQLLHMHMSINATPVHELRSEVPAALSAVVAKMMAKDPAQRYQTPAEVAKALTPFVKGSVQALPAQLAAAVFDPRTTMSAVHDVRSGIRGETVIARGRQGTMVEKCTPHAQVSPHLAAYRSWGARGGRKLPIGAAAGVGVLLVLALGIALLAGGKLMLRTKDGTIVLENLPAEATVLVDGEKLILKLKRDASPIEIRKAPGTHRLEIKRDGFKIEVQDVTLAAGDRKGITLRWEPLESAVDKGGRGKDAPLLADGFVPLFNGKDVKGWKTHPEQPGDWRVEKGILIGRGTLRYKRVQWEGNICSSLYTDRDDYQDFHLLVEARVNDQGNSGVFLRSSFGPAYPPWQPTAPLAYEAEINANGPGSRTGSLWSVPGDTVIKTLRPAPAPGVWFKLEAIVTGNSFVIKVDGNVTASWSDQRLGRARGHIALQCDPNTVVEFRRIEIKELTSTKPAAADALSKTLKLDSSPIQVLRGHATLLKHVIFTHDGKRLVSASNADQVANGRNVPGKDNTVRVWSVESGQQIHMFRVDEGLGWGPQGIDVSPDGQFAAACTSQDWGYPETQPRVFVWDIASGTRKHHFVLSGNRAMRAVGFSKDGRSLHAVRSGPGIHSWSLTDGLETGTIVLDRQSLNEVPLGTVFTPGCRYIAGGAWKKADAPFAVRLWNRETGKLEKSFVGHQALPAGIAMSQDGTRILSCAADLSVRLWDVKSGSEVWCVDSLDSNIRCVAISPDGKQFLTGGDDKMVRLWDIDTRKQLACLEGHTDVINCVAFSPDATLAASGSNDKTIRLWRLSAKPGH